MHMAAIKGLRANAARKRIDELLQVVNLMDAARRPLGGYSSGMKQRDRTPLARFRGCTHFRRAVQGVGLCGGGSRLADLSTSANRGALERK